MTMRQWTGLMLLAGLLAVPGVAAAQGAWVAVDGAAVAGIETPAGNVRLVCAERRWHLELDLEAPLEVARAARLRVDQHEFPAEPGRRGDEFVMELPQEALEPLAAGIRMSVAIGDESLPAEAVDFPLRGSRRAIEEAASRCSAPDMTAYTPLTLSPYSSYIGLAAELRAEDVTKFEAATSSTPKLSVAMAEFGQARRLLVVSLCGSSWYHGATGCSLTGHAAVPEGDWDLVLESEGAEMFYDPSSRTGGWPDMVTLPATAHQPRSWRWNGGRYVPQN